MKKRTKGLITLAIAAFSTVVLAQSFTTFPQVRVQNQLDVQGTVTANGATGTSGQVLTSNGASDVTWTTPAATVFGANPTALAGPTAVNGTALTFLRSDGAPAINQTSAYSWTGVHKWLGTSTRTMMGAADFNTRTVGATSAMIQVEGTGNATSSMSIVRNNASSGGGILTFGHSRENIVGGIALVVNGESLGTVDWAGADGVDMEARAASIVGAVDGAPGVGDMPGRLQFNTTADGAEAPTERFRINSAGALGIAGANFGTTAQAIVSAGSAAAPSWQTVCLGGATCLFGDGTAAAPSIAFTSDTNTGIYRFGAESIGFAANGTNLGWWDENGLVVSDTFAFIKLRSTNPTQTVSFADDTGVERSNVGENAGTLFLQKVNTGNIQIQTSSGNISLIPGGSGIVGLSGPTQFTSTMRGPAGTAGAPAFSFTSDTNDGIYDSGTDQVAIATGGTQRLTVGAAGEIGLGSGNSVGTAGQVLTSGGSAATPTWSNPSIAKTCTATCNLTGLLVGQVAMIRKPNTQDVTSSTTLTADNELQFSNAPAGGYIMTGMYDVTDGGGGVRVGFSASGVRATGNTSCAGTLQVLAVTTTNPGAMQCATAATSVFTYQGIITRGSAGAITVMFAQQTSNATATTMGTASFVMLTRYY